MASTFAHLTGFLYGARLPVQVGGATAVLPGRVGPGAVRRAGRGAPHHLHVGGDAVPARHRCDAPDLAERDLSSLVRFCCMGAPIPRAIVRDGPAQAARPGGARRLGADRGRAGHPRHPGRPRREDRRTRRLPVARACGSGWSTTSAARAARRQRGPGAGHRAVPVRRLPDRLEHDRARSSTASGSTPATWRTIDADGYLTISGRTKDMIIRGGENIPVAYVENVLYEHPQIAGGRGRRRARPAAAGTGLRLRRARRPGAELTFDDMQARSSPRRAWPSSTGPSGWSSSPSCPARPAARSRSSGCATRSGADHDHRVPRRRGAHPDRPLRRRAGAGAARRPGRPRVRALTERLPSVDWAAVDDVVLGLRQPGRRGQPQRRPDGRAARRACRSRCPGATVNRLCGSGLDAVAIAARAVRAGDADLVIAGGVESMSRAPFVLPKAAAAVVAHDRDPRHHDRLAVRQPADAASATAPTRCRETARDRRRAARHLPRGPGRVRAALAAAGRPGDRRRPAGPGDRAGPGAAHGGASRWSVDGRRAPAGDLARGAGEAARRSPPAAPSPPATPPGSTTARPRVLVASERRGRAATGWSRSPGSAAAPSPACRRG